MEFQSEEAQNADELIERALAEDLATAGDVTTMSLVPKKARGTVLVVGRAEGILAGVPVAQRVFERLDQGVLWSGRLADGASLSRGSVIAELTGNLRSLLTGERTALNFLMHLSGVATATKKFVDAIEGSKARILDTRKTLPGWRRLEKYAVRVGGGANLRIGLWDGCLIKDNHLAAARAAGLGSIEAAIAQARDKIPPGLPIEVEVDTLEQLADALAGRPDIVLLDNMDAGRLRDCVELRDRLAPNVLLEASGGITLANVREIAATGVDRISVGAITHSAPALDMAFDWPTERLANRRSAAPRG